MNRAALIATIAALGAIVLGVALRKHFVPRGDLPALPPSPPHDEYAAIPADWRDFAVVDHVREETAKRVKVDEGLAYDQITWLAPLGDVFVNYQTDPCIGGSACTGARPTLHDLRIGHVDESGAPSLSATVDCIGDPRIETINGGRRSCNAESLTLRRSSDGKIEVVTFRDPDTEEKAVYAFTTR